MTAEISPNRERSVAKENLRLNTPGSVVKMAERVCPPLPAPNHIVKAPVMHRSVPAQSIDTSHAYGGCFSGSSRYPSSELLHRRNYGLYAYHVWVASFSWNSYSAALKSQEKSWDDNEVQNHYNGFGLKFTTRLPSFYKQTVILQISYQRLMGADTLHCSIAFVNVVPKNSRVMDVVRVGDTESLGRLFGTGKAHYNDMTPDGISLLHVSLSLRNWPEFLS